MRISDITLIGRVKRDNCEKSLKELIVRHSALCYKVFFKYSSLLNSYGIDFNESLKEKDYVLYKSVISYNPQKKAKFSTWLGNFTRYHCLNLINQRKGHTTLEDSELNYHMEKNSRENNVFDPKEMMELREFFLNILSQVKDNRVKRVFDLRYFSGEDKMTWSKVSKTLNISIQTAINLHERGRKILKRKMKSVHAEDFI
jgi:RNA polymerase sigma factor (sigma-70 family)